jgi:eukaryotic-like serine/threonine-protein kinase
MTATTGDELLARASERVGAVLCGKYRLDRVLGVGGMATVYAAVHLRNANRVAVKILHGELGLDAGIRARFMREGYAANSVEHPGTVRILDDDTSEDGSVFLVMDLLEGETLDARWERSGRKLPVGEVLAILSELLDVLVAAHAKGIVHRDLKPENLFVTREGRIKVLDFGVARLLEGSPMSTRTGAVLGTPAFMPPEQALGRAREVDALSDIWAVGATAFALLSGRCVHTGETVEEMQVHAATRKAPPLLSVAPNVPPAIAAVVDRALAFERQDRWPSAHAMQEALTLARDSKPEARPLSADDWDRDERTALGPPPAMTLRGTGTSPVDAPSEQPTVPLPTLPAASTVAGVASHSEASVKRRGRRLLGLGAGGLLIVVVGMAVALAMGARGSAPIESKTASSASSEKAQASAGLPAATAPPASITPAEEPPVVAVETLPTAAAPPRAPAPPVALPQPSIAPFPRPATTSAPIPVRAAAQPTQSPAASAPRPRRDPLAP